MEKETVMKIDNKKEGVIKTNMNIKRKPVVKKKYKDNPLVKKVEWKRN